MKLPPALAAAALAAAILAAPAQAQLRSVSEGGRPVLFGDQVLWETGSNGTLGVLSAPIAGGPATPFGSLPVGADDAAWLAAGGGQVGVLLREVGDPSALGRLWTAGTDGAFRQIAGDVPEAPLSLDRPPLQATVRGLVTLGSAPALRDLTGRARGLVLPPGAEPELVATSGELGVAAAEGVLVVFDLRSGTEIRQIGLGRYEDETILGLALSPAGEVAATVPVGDGDDVLLWGGLGDSEVRALASGQEFGDVATAAGRVAFVRGRRSGEGRRPEVLDATGRSLYRGPWTIRAGGLDFDGRNLALWTWACALAGPVDGVGDQPRLPGGPCQESEVAVEPQGVRGGRLPVRLDCVNAPAARCRVDAVVRLRSGAVVGSASARPARGGTRLLKIALSARGRRADQDSLRLTVRVTEPDGRSHVAHDL